MPIVKKIGGPSVTIYLNVHRPAHVQVIGREYEAVFDLGCPDGPPELRENFGFSPKAIAGIESALLDDLTSLCDAWRRIHGYP